MPCLLGCLALVAPRVVLVLVWLFSDYLGEAYETVLWPLLGFLVLPLTTLTYAWAWHFEPEGSMSGLAWPLVIVAALIDLGIIGGNAKARKQGKSD